MNVPHPPSGPAGGPVAVLRRLGLHGITGKIAAIVAGLLAVFAVSVAALVSQVETLGHPDPTIEALDAGHHLSSKVLVAFEAQSGAWHEALLAGADTAERTTSLQAFREAGARVDQLLTQTVAELPAGPHREAAQRFGAEHKDLTARYEKAFAAFVASGGGDIGTAHEAMDGLAAAPFERFEQATEAVDEELDRLTEERVAVVDRRVMLIVAIGGLLLLGLVLVTAMVVRRVVRPIRDLAGAAERIAGQDLPAAVAQVRGLEDGEAPPTLEPLVVTSRDETASLARAVDSLQTSALSLAVEQRRAERESAEMLVNLGRRNQNLLNRTLAYITELERTETDPDVLDRLFRLDHATTRIRRNAESMLVLAGAHQTRTWSVPAPIGDVVRAALSEIEDYNRIDLYHVQDAAVSGGVVADIVHLLAEVIENAANFSPPSTHVTVVGQHVAEGYRIRVIDEGIGMTRSELDAANRSIRLATEGTGASKLLGLYVVGRLAARRGIEVSLEASGGRGVTANVVVPRALLTEIPDPDSAGGAPAPARSGDAVGEVVRHLGPGRAAVREPVREPGHEAERERYVQAAFAAARPQGVAVPAEPGVAPTTTATTTATTMPGPDPVPAIVQRVRGAQLPDLGPDLDVAPTIASLEAIDVRGRLSSLQAGVRAGREVALPGVEHAPEPASGPSAVRTQPAAGGADVPVPAPGPTSGEPSRVTDEPGSTPEDPSATPRVPIRVRGAQLPELGLMEGSPDSYLAPPAEANRWRLRSFQLDVDAARRTAEGSVPDDLGRNASTPEEP